jgi:tetratricopeptide (TPR) repeat protein
MVAHQSLAACRPAATVSCTKANTILSALCRLTLLGGVVSLCGCRMMSQQQNCQGVTQFQQGNYQQAVASFSQAVQTDPQNPDAYYNLAAAWHQQAKQTGDQNAWLQAEQLYNRCLDISPDNVECHRALAVLLVETNRSDKALTLVKNWAIRSPNVSAARVELARMYEELGDSQTAATYLSQAIQINPNDARALAALGKMREQSGDTAQALANYQRAYQLNPSAPGVAQRLATLSQSLPAATQPAGTIPANVAPNLNTAPPGSAGTRIVTQPTAPPRY